MPHALTTAAETPIHSDVNSALRRVRADFMEMPDLQVTLAQAVRLWGLDAAVCSVVLAMLVDTRFLVRTSKALFSRA